MLEKRGTFFICRELISTARGTNRGALLMTRGFVRFTSLLYLAAGLSFLLNPAYAQDSSERPVMKAARAAAAPTLDGVVLGDPGWSSAEPATGPGSPST